jgi:hypothetical protein
VDFFFFPLGCRHHVVCVLPCRGCNVFFRFNIRCERYTARQQVICNRYDTTVSSCIGILYGQVVLVVIAIITFSRSSGWPGRSTVSSSPFTDLLEPSAPAPVNPNQTNVVSCSSSRKHHGHTFMTTLSGCGSQSRILRARGPTLLIEHETIGTNILA